MRQLYVLNLDFKNSIKKNHFKKYSIKKNIDAPALKEIYAIAYLTIFSLTKCHITQKKVQSNQCIFCLLSKQAKGCKAFNKNLFQAEKREMRNYHPLSFILRRGDEGLISPENWEFKKKKKSSVYKITLKIY